ncbi:TIGR00299 family protein [Clostridiales bacterium oral taxon 876 str. F0540]|nr:TIGR00299 family protein [Clostridiales bacterium oral taxon 876 str. F0540]
MRILYYDCFSGISGDMNLGAMIDLGVPKEYLINELSKLNISGYEIEVQEDNRKGITGTKVKVRLDSEEKENIAQTEHDHHSHSGLNHSHNEHIHELSHTYIQSHGEHRNLKAIERIIDDSLINEEVKALSKKIFLKVAEAEAKIHGKTIEEVHFHEVGAVDSIVDIIGAAICFDYLKVDKVMSASVELGGGFVKCAHGLFPVPAPATVEILKGVPIKLGAVQVETTTPTGAAILAAIVDEFTDKKEFVINKISYGIGHRDTVIPNVLRVYLGETMEKDSNKAYEEAYMIECNIDDMNPEYYEYVIDKLFDFGAMDVYMTPIIMKKGRPAVKLSVLCSVSIEDKITELILRETTTLGVRKYKTEKTMLRREFSKVKTKYGDITIKSSLLNGEKIKQKPEYEECKAIAKENNIPLSLVYEEVLRKLSLKDNNL